MYPFFDLNDEERTDYQHTQLTEAMMVGWGRTSPYAAIYRRAHDRIFGKICERCLAAPLARIEAAYKRPPEEPVRDAPKLRRPSARVNMKPFSLEELLYGLSFGSAHEDDPLG